MKIGLVSVRLALHCQLELSLAIRIYASQMYFLNNFLHRVINFCFRSAWFRLKLITKITIDTVFLAPHSIMFGTSTTKEFISIFGHFLDPCGSKKKCFQS